MQVRVGWADLPDDAFAVGAGVQAALLQEAHCSLEHLLQHRTAACSSIVHFQINDSINDMLYYFMAISDLACVIRS